MRLRATLASLLTVILLSISPATSNCEIKCDIAKTQPSCHSSSVQAHRQMAGMPGMEQNASLDFQNEFSALIATAPVCRTHACAQQPAVFSEQKAVFANISVATEMVFSDFAQFAHEPVIATFYVRGPPHYRPSTPVSLRTTLRV